MKGGIQIDPQGEQDEGDQRGQDQPRDQIISAAPADVIDGLARRDPRKGQIDEVAETSANQQKTFLQDGISVGKLFDPGGIEYQQDDFGQRAGIALSQHFLLKGFQTEIIAFIQRAQRFIALAGNPGELHTAAQDDVKGICLAALLIYQFSPG